MIALSMVVPSESDPEMEYIVSKINGFWTCTCPGFKYHGKCKHRQAAIAAEYDEIFGKDGDNA